MASTLKLDKSQIHLRVSYGSERKKQSRTKGRWPGTGQPSSYTFPQGIVKISFAKNIFSAAFIAEEELFLREIEVTFWIQNRQRRSTTFNGCFSGSPAVSISDGGNVIQLKRNRKMRQFIRFEQKASTLKIIWEFNCFVPESEICPIDPILLTHKNGGLQPGPIKAEHRIPQGTPETMWISPQDNLRGIRVNTLEENLSWMERERVFFNIIRLEKIHIKAGDWESLHTDYRGKIGFINRRIEHNGMIPALTFEPFYADMDSELARIHPEWLVGNLKGGPLTINVNRQRKVYILDFTRLEVKEYLEESLNIFRKQWGFRSFHLQGLSALLYPGLHADNRMESGKILYSAFDFFRKVLGKDCFISAENAPLITEVNHIDMLSIPTRISAKRKSGKEIKDSIYRFLETSSLTNYPWILNSGNYPLTDSEKVNHKQAEESLRQMLLIGGGIISFSIHLPAISEHQKEELLRLMVSFKKFSKAEIQLLECPHKDDTSILYNSSGYLGVFNLSLRKQQVTLNMERLKQAIYNRTGESAIQEGRTGMKTGELELIIPPLGSRIFKF